MAVPKTKVPPMVQFKAQGDINEIVAKARETGEVAEVPKQLLEWASPQDEPKELAERIERDEGIAIIMI